MKVWCCGLITFIDDQYGTFISKRSQPSPKSTPTAIPRYRSAPSTPCSPPSPYSHVPTPSRSTPRSTPSPFVSPAHPPPYSPTDSPAINQQLGDLENIISENKRYEEAERANNEFDTYFGSPSKSPATSTALSILPPTAIPILPRASAPTTSEQRARPTATRGVLPPLSGAQMREVMNVCKHALPL